MQGGKKSGAQGVTVLRGATGVPATPGMRLEVGDELATDSMSQAVIVFPDQSWVILDAETAVRISSLSLTRGTLFAKVRRLFQLETQFVRVSVEGTEYRVQVDPGGQTSVDVAEGSTRLISKAGSWNPVAVREREGAVTAGQAPPQTRQLTPEEVARIRRQFRTFEALFTAEFVNWGIMIRPGPPMPLPQPRTPVPR